MQEEYVPEERYYGPQEDFEPAYPGEARPLRQELIEMPRGVRDGEIIAQTPSFIPQSNVAARPVIPQEEVLQECINID